MKYTRKTFLSLCQKYNVNGEALITTIERYREGSLYANNFSIHWEEINGNKEIVIVKDGHGLKIFLEE
jgi:hypothetical protein